MKYKNNLFQYDQNQTITNVDGLFVDYILNDETLRVPVVDGNAIIPNEVLAVAGMHYAYVCLANETRLEFRFKVTARVAPPDVPYAPSHAITFDDLVKTVQDEVKSLEERAASGEFDGKDGQDYVITPADYDAIAERVTLEGVVKTVNHVAPDAEGNVDVQGGGETTDVQLNGVSITKDGVANIPVAGETLGVVKVQSNGVYGIESVAGGHVAIKSPTTKDITDRAPYKAVTLDVLDDAVSTSLNKPKKTSPIDTWASARKNMKAQTEFTAGTNLEWVEEQTTLGKKYTLNAAGYDDTEIKGQIEALDGSVVKTVNGVAPVDGNVDVQGGGSSVTMADNAQGGVDLTVDGSTKTLAKEGELATIKADLNELNTEVQNHETRIKAIEEGGGVGTVDYVARQQIAEITYIEKSVNLYDEEHNKVVQTNPQYSVGTVYLDGYVGDLCVSTAGRQAAYFTPVYVKDIDGNVLVSSWNAGNLYNSTQNRMGKCITIPNGAYKIEFEYRTEYSGGTLISDVMVTKGSNILEQLSYIPYYEVLKPKAPYEEEVFVAYDGSDDNDGLSIDSPLKTIAKALAYGRNIKVKRGVYNEILNISNIDGITISPSDKNEVYSDTNPNRRKIELVGNTSFNNVSLIDNCNDLIFVDVVFRDSLGSAVSLKNSTNVKFYNCEANNSSTANGFEVINTDAIFFNCYATNNRYDGFNFHGYGTTIMNDCVSENNFDDGCSHHDGCYGTINGGEFVGNGKAGIAPAYGAIVNIYGAICQSNKIGIGYLTTTGHREMRGNINSCLMADNEVGLKVDSRCTVKSVSSKFSNNTTDKQIGGTLYEF